MLIPRWTTTITNSASLWEACEDLEWRPNGRQVARYLLWDGDALVAELGANGQRQVDYVYLPGTIDKPFAHTLGVTAPNEVRTMSSTNWVT